MEDINKDIEILEEKIKIIESLCTDNCINETTVIRPLKYAIEHLIKAYKELEEENMQLEACKDEVIRRYNFECIPVSLVEEKIEKLKQDIRNKKTRYPYILGHKIDILQELLEKRK